MMEVSVGDVVMPGDVVKDIIPSKRKAQLILGPGLRRDGDLILACKAGILKKRTENTFYVDSYQKRYIPNKNENVVGIVAQKVGDIFKVDIGASEQASLSYLAFEGATKKNRPDVQVGDVVYAKLLTASKAMEPEVVCVDSLGKKQKLGILSPDGMLFSCSLSLVRKILNPECRLFQLLAKNKAYELAAGMNGKIWIKARNVQETIAVANAILAAEYVAPSEMPNLCENIEKTLFGFRKVRKGQTEDAD